MSKINLLILYLIFGIVLAVLGIVLIFIWFGWKLALALFIYQWGNSICKNNKL
jgi:flagellar basal body-associated protein FliL